MRRKLLLFFILLVLCQLSSMASINVDAPTIAAMGAAYELEKEIEEGAATATDSVRGHYEGSSVATAGIYAAEKKRFDALRSSKLFDSSEFAYYVRIKHLVANMIMPKLLTVAYGMIQRPQNVLYWGPYLYKVTTSVENLCKQFQFICTNGKLDFKDVQFLVINKQLVSLFDLAKAGNQDWPGKFRNLANTVGSLTWDDIKEDFDHLETTALSIAGGAISSDLANATNIGRVFHATREQVNDIYASFKEVYDKLNNVAQAERELMSVIGTKDVEGLAKLFEVSDYNINSYMISYLKELQDQYYTQRWYICAEDQGTKEIAAYRPAAPAETNNEDDWSGWIYKCNYQEKSNPPYPALTDSEAKQLQSAAESVTGWNSNRKADYEKNNPGHTISLDYEQNSYSYIRDKKGGTFSHSKHWRGKHFTVYMTVTDSWSTKQEVYEEMFDSQTMDLATFKKRMEVRLQGYKDNTADDDSTQAGNFVYKLCSDPPRYYQQADSKKLKGSNSVSFISKCDGGQNLGSGAFNWKVNSRHGNSLEWPKSKNLAMDTNVDYDATNQELNKFKQKTDSINDRISFLEERVKSLDDQLNIIGRQITQASMAGNQSKVNELRNQQKNLQAEQDGYELELISSHDMLDDLNSSKQELLKDMESDSEADKTRIPSNMAMFQSAYQIEWTDEGEWVQGSEFVFTRHGYSNSGKFKVTYTARLSLARKEKHFLGIRIHRAILSVDYALTSEYSSSSVIETMQLDKSRTDEENSAIVNKRLKELMSDFPDCSVEIKYNATSDIDDDEDTPDGIHWLYANERLEIASQIEDQLADIYANLQNIEKMLYVRNTIKRFLTDIIRDYVDVARRKAVIEQCLYDWRDNAKNAKEIADSLRNDTTGVVNPPSQ